MPLPAWLQDDIAMADLREAAAGRKPTAPIPYETYEALRGFNCFVVRAMVPLTWTGRPSRCSSEPGALEREMFELLSKRAGDVMVSL